jgi:hypothetical protein
VIAVHKGRFFTKKVNEVLAELWHRRPDSFVELWNVDTKGQRNEIGRIILKGEDVKAKIPPVLVQLNRQSSELQISHSRTLDERHYVSHRQRIILP